MLAEGNELPRRNRHSIRKIENFSLAPTERSPGSTRFSFTVTPKLPSSMGGFVNYIGGIDNFLRVKPQNTYVDAPQLMSNYNVASLFIQGNHGEGRTVAITNYDGYGLSNLPYVYSQWGYPTPSGGVGSNVSVVSINGRNGSTSSASGEADLDIQCALSMAPLCNLIIYDNASLDGGQDDIDPISTLTREANDNLADIVTDSYGFENTSDFYASLHAQHLAMSAEGITYMVASGDNGTFDVGMYPYPDIDPDVLDVGGTTLNLDSNGNRTTETAWALGVSGASGGGWSVSGDTSQRPAFVAGRV